MRKIIRKAVSAVTFSFIGLISALQAFAAVPIDNDSTAKAAMAEQFGVPVSAESSAFPEWILYSVIGAAVVIAMIVLAIILGSRKSRR